jgi:hypothetical protein
VFAPVCVGTVRTVTRRASPGDARIDLFATVGTGSERIVVKAASRSSQIVHPVNVAVDELLLEVHLGAGKRIIHLVAITRSELQKTSASATAIFRRSSFSRGSIARTIG